MEEGQADQDGDKEIGGISLGVLAALGDAGEKFAALEVLHDEVDFPIIFGDLKKFDDISVEAAHLQETK